MWDADKNRLTPGVDYKIDPQGKTRFHSREDHARDPLFTFVDPAVLQRETYRSECLNFLIHIFIHARLFSRAKSNIVTDST